MKTFSISNWYFSKQTVLLGDKVLTILDKPNGLVLAQWNFDEIVDIAFFKAERRIGGKQVPNPHGEVRIAKSWAERRIGLMNASGSKNRLTPLGVIFDVRHENEALQLYQELMEHPNIQLHEPQHTAQVETERFVLTLTDNELIITYRIYATTFKQLLDTALTSAEFDAETTLPLAAVSGTKIRGASDDKISSGFLSGRLLIFTTSVGGTWSVLGATRNELELDFSKSAESKIREFVDKLEASLRGKSRGSAAENNAPTRSLAEEIKELDALRQSGALSEEEFTAAKAKLLAS
tara:strand:+ start:431 stop:1309 length:879 start_codon:yes stop_codon:yes gene_type:complete